MDLEKPGFFHFDLPLVQGELPVDVVTYWAKKQSQQLELWPSKCPELGAIQNTIGLFNYVLQGKAEAIPYFKTLLEKPGRSKVNTLANLNYLLHLDGDQGELSTELSTELEVLQSDTSLTGRLQLARAMCERGYFCGYYVIEEVHNPHLVKLSAQLLHKGIENGKASGMSQNEICIWQFYLFKVTKDIFVNQVLRKDAIEEFESMMGLFLEFYFDVEDELNYYKSRALIEVAVMFTFQRDEIKDQPNFSKFCQEDETLKELLDDVTSGCDEAMALCPSDYRIPLKAAKVFSKLGHFDKAEQFIEKSLELNKDLNIAAMNCRMILCNKRAFKASTVDKDEQASAMWHHKAYDIGKNIEKANNYVTTATLVEMNNICMNMAIDRRRQPWQVPAEKQIYLDEAIDYGKRAVASFTHGDITRALSGLGECLAFKKNYIEAAKCLGKASLADKAGQMKNIKKYLRYLSEQYHQLRQNDTVLEIATAFENGWQKHPKEDALEVFVQYANNYIGLKNRLIGKVVEELSSRSSEVATEVLQEFCRTVISKPCKASWLNDICQQHV